MALPPGCRSFGLFFDHSYAVVHPAEYGNHLTGTSDRGARDGNSVGVGAYHPDSALRVYVFTDGEDTDSPGAYRGTNGMNVLQRSLLSRGFRIEWHIVILDFGMNNWTEDTLEQFEALCDATGGSFGLIRGEPDPEITDGTDTAIGKTLNLFLGSVGSSDPEALAIEARKSGERLRSRERRVKQTE